MLGRLIHLKKTCANEATHLRDSNGIEVLFVSVCFAAFVNSVWIIRLVERVARAVMELNKGRVPIFQLVDSMNWSRVSKYSQS